MVPSSISSLTQLQKKGFQYDADAVDIFWVIYYQFCADGSVTGIAIIVSSASTYWFAKNKTKRTTLERKAYASVNCSHPLG